MSALLTNHQPQEITLSRETYQLLCAERDKWESRAKFAEALNALRLDQPSSQDLLYRCGLNHAVEGAKRFLELYEEIAELEHECPDPDCERFIPCLTCDSIAARDHEQNEIVAKWAREWATLIASVQALAAGEGQ